MDPERFQRYFVQQGRFTAGVATRYRPSSITADAPHQHLADGFTVGMRFHSAPVIRLADARPVHLGHVARADGAWRLYVFGDRSDPTRPDAAVGRLCEFLLTDASPITRHTPPGAEIDAVIDVRAIFQQGHRTIDLGALPRALLPRKGRFGLVDYEKAFCADAADDIFDARGIDRHHGCVVVVRPDQYVAHVLPLDATHELAAFFARFLRNVSDDVPTGHISGVVNQQPARPLPAPRS